MIDLEIKKQVSNVDGQRAENEGAVPCVPEPTVTGNDKIEILNHEFYFSGETQVQSFNKTATPVLDQKNQVCLI